ncbi:MFS transporter [Chondromyces crocatus]|uniref:MFS transporter n=1 Tax=Chondromyces crocatus TaxID=52 RepID=A0A0K1ELY4_CHOCO|nr:MFS transporter [Chondromyces crocatus]AKT41672.1 MFS transporter [Chondromyces crocatus]
MAKDIPAINLPAPSSEGTSSSAVVTAPPSAWSPLRHPAFRSLWLAALASNLGLWIQNAAGSWDMTTLSSAPLHVALLQTASSFPVFLVGLPAAAFGDIFDRRRLLLSFATWMALTSATLAALSFTGTLTPERLLALTFALGLGAALSAPLWQSILPTLVDRTELAPAVTLGGVAINIARAVGPALGGIGIALAGSAPVYTFNALAFSVVVFQVVRWKQQRPTSHLPPERVVGAIIAGLRFARRAPALQSVLLRSGAFILAGSALWALLPLVARRELHLSPLGFGLLLGCIGAGALAGAAILPRYRARLGTDRLVVLASFLYAAAMLTLAHVRFAPALYVAMTATGVAWIAILSSLNVAAASAAPGWVQSRALGLYLLVFQGGQALGSLAWGALAGRLGTALTLTIAASALLVGLLIAVRHRLGIVSKDDVAPWRAFPEPVLAQPVHIDAGPVLIQRRHVVAPEQRAAFLRLARDLEPVRRRDGAMTWTLFEDVAAPGIFIETFLVASWGEHLRQHHRATAADQKLFDALDQVARDEGVTHLIDAYAAAEASARGEPVG